MQDRYYTSKLLQEIALIELCCIVSSSKGIVNVVNSGFCYGSALQTEVTTRFRVLGIIVTFAKRMIGDQRPLERVRLWMRRSCRDRRHMDSTSAIVLATRELLLLFHQEHG